MSHWLQINGQEIAAEITLSELCAARLGDEYVLTWPGSARVQHDELRRVGVAPFSRTEPMTHLVELMSTVPGGEPGSAQCLLREVRPLWLRDGPGPDIVPLERRLHLKTSGFQFVRGNLDELEEFWRWNQHVPPSLDRKGKPLWSICRRPERSNSDAG